MTTKITTVKDGGDRFYVATPDDGPPVRVPGVTTALGVIPKDFLRYWYAKMAAELAIDSFPFLSDMAARDRDGAVAYIKGAAQRYTAQRSKLGTEAHDYFELMVRGEDPGPAPAHLVNHVAHFAEFLDAVQPELLSAEDVAWSSRHGYAGSYDAQLRIKVNPETGRCDPQGEPKDLVVDWKTGKAVYADVALQLAAYAHAEERIDVDGNRSPMGDLDGAAVLHITDQVWRLQSVRVDEVVFNMFLRCLEFHGALQDWRSYGYGPSRVKGLEDKVLGAYLAKSPRRVTGSERRA